LSAEAKFAVGQLVSHVLFEYRGVIFDLDSDFQGTEEWYEEVARSRPPKDEPWYHVLVHEAGHTTYVAEQNLESDDSGLPIKNPHVNDLFDELGDSGYVLKQKAN